MDLSNGNDKFKIGDVVEVNVPDDGSTIRFFVKINRIYTNYYVCDIGSGFNNISYTRIFLNYYGSLASKAARILYFN